LTAGFAREPRAATRSDGPRLLELNGASVRELSPLDEPRLRYTSSWPTAV